MGHFDDYEVGEKIGVGGFADVFHATHRLTGRHVAMKVARDDEESKGRIGREIAVQGQLHHANVLTIIDSDSEAPTWFATEVAEGNLGQLYAADALGPGDILRLAEEMLGALGAAHRREHFHRDLSPENILRLHGAWVLADWGYVTAGAESGGPTRMTRTGTAGGTFTWAAPEMFVDPHRADGRADLYALGKIIAWLVSGELAEVRARPKIAPATAWTPFLQAVTEDDREERPPTAEAALPLLTRAAQTIPAPPTRAMSSAALVPTTSTVQVAALRRFLVNPADRIRLDELIRAETAKLASELRTKQFDFNTPHDAAALELRLERYHDVTLPLTHLLFNGSYYGDASVRGHWTATALRVAAARKSDGGFTTLIEMRLASPLLVTYAAALGALMGGSAANFAAVTVDPTVRWNNSDRDIPLIVEVHVGSVPFHDIFREENGRSRRITPGSDWLFERLRPIAQAVIVNDDEYEVAFDQLEILIAMIMVDRGLSWASGRFVWKDRFLHRPNVDVATTPVGRLAELLLGSNERWSTFGTLLFGGDRARIIKSRDVVLSLAQRQAF